MSENYRNKTSAKESKLVDDILKSKSSENVVPTDLETDERIIARITDGIYRQPGSALRELISNAYDADATRVVIKTDAPRFNRMTIEDNGHGMSPRTLAHLLLHIGGSAKRSDIGKELGVSQEDDPTRSPGGRKLIGKIGIGLFSVAQLTYKFQIITKVKGDPFRTIATVALKQYSDEDFFSKSNSDKENKKEAGKVKIWRESAVDKDSQGTTIILTSIRPQARDTLQSQDVWTSIEQSRHNTDPDDEYLIDPPEFHIGHVDKSGKLLNNIKGKEWFLPWTIGDEPDVAFKKLVQAVWDIAKQSDPNPKLERYFDYYLRMVWQLGLAIPLPYVERHLFDESLNRSIKVLGKA